MSRRPALPPCKIHTVSIHTVYLTERPLSARYPVSYTPYIYIIRHGVPHRQGPLCSLLARSLPHRSFPSRRPLRRSVFGWCALVGERRRTQGGTSLCGTQYVQSAHLTGCPYAIHTRPFL